MQQLRIKTEKEENTAVKSCVFTGHRTLEEDFSPKKLKKEIKALIEQGVDVFYNGMAMGFDLLAAETVLSFKKKYPQIKLIACIPCYKQEKSFPERDKKRYVEILKKVDEKVLLAEEYYRGCMQVRDKYMAERADVMIAYCKKTTGGAAFTVKCFQKSCPNGKIIFL
jgi:uncharacterized phage-like protein YoqJ